VNWLANLHWVNLIGQTGIGEHALGAKDNGLKNPSKIVLKPNQNQLQSTLKKVGLKIIQTSLWKLTGC